MNEMRYAKGNAKDYAQHPDPIKAPSAPEWANTQASSLLPPTRCRKLREHPEHPHDHQCGSEAKL